MLATALTQSSAQPAVSGISNTAGLAWNHRGSGGIPSDPNYASANEIWWAHAPEPLSSDVITVSFNVNVFDVDICAFGVNGANLTTPFDTNASLPGKAYNDSSVDAAVQVTGISTTAANTMMIASWQTGYEPGDTNSGAAPGTGYTTIANDLYTAGFVYENQAQSEYQVFSEPQSGITVGFNFSGRRGSIIVDALQASSGGASTIIFRRSLSPLGTRIGSRQVFRG